MPRRRCPNGKRLGRSCPVPGVNEGLVTHSLEGPRKCESFAQLLIRVDKAIAQANCEDFRSGEAIAPGRRAARSETGRARCCRSGTDAALSPRGLQL